MSDGVILAGVDNTFIRIQLNKDCLKTEISWLILNFWWFLHMEKSQRSTVVHFSVDSLDSHAFYTLNAHWGLLYTKDSSDRKN